MQTNSPDYADAGPLARPAVKRRRFKLSKRWAPYVFVAPFMLFFVVFLVLPLIYALQLSTWRETLVGGNTFVGFANYQRVFGDAKFWEGMLRTFGFGLVQVPVMLGLALVFALIIDAGTVWGRAVFRIGFFIPYAVPGVIAALIWGYLYGPSYGPITQVFNAIGVTAPNFLDGSLVLPGIGNIVTWEFTGYNMIILYSALQSIPSDLEEAAAIEGAKGWQIAWLIKIPMIAPALLLTLVFSVIGTLQLFGEPKLLRIMAPHALSPNFTPNMYAYDLAFVNQEYNYSAATSFVLGAVVVVASYLCMYLANRKK